MICNVLRRIAGKSDFRWRTPPLCRRSRQQKDACTPSVLLTSEHNDFGGQKENQCRTQLSEIVGLQIERKVVIGQILQLLGVALGMKGDSLATSAHSSLRGRPTKNEPSLIFSPENSPVLPGNPCERGSFLRRYRRLAATLWPQRSLSVSSQNDHTQTWTQGIPNVAALRMPDTIHSFSPGDDSHPHSSANCYVATRSDVAATKG